MTQYVDVNAMLEALGVATPTPRYAVSVDAQTMLTLAEKMVGAGAKPQVYTPHWSDTTVVISEYNKGGEWQIKCYCRDKYQADTVRADIANAVAIGRMEREQRLKGQLTLPGFEDVMESED